MGARAEQLDAPLPNNRQDSVQRGLQIFHRLRRAVADAGDDFDGVAQQFLVHTGVFADLGEYCGGFVTQVARLGVDKRELPFDSKCRAG